MKWSFWQKYKKGSIDEKYREEIENSMSTDSYKIEILLCCMILIIETVMIVTFILKKNGPFASLRREAYFFMYIFLFTVTLILLMIFNWGRKIYSAKFHQWIRFIYGFILVVWACGITLLDELGMGGQSVFGYMITGIAALLLLKPWQSIMMFSSSFILLNALLLAFPNGTNNVFSNVINSLSITTFAIFISIENYHAKVTNYYNRIIIRKQYQEILEKNQNLSEIAMTDELTNMNNRRYLENVIRSMLKNKEVTGDYITGFMVDIDFFKNYNDRYGHQAGDECLKIISSEITAFTKRQSACCVRYGGEEFFVVIFNCGEKIALEKAESLRIAIEDKRIECIAHPKGYVTISIGIYVTPYEKDLEMENFIGMADKALYDAKRNGRNRVEIFNA